MRRVPGPGMPMVVPHCFDAKRPRKLDCCNGVVIAPAEPAGAEWLELFTFDPGKKTFITVQSQESWRMQYRQTVLHPIGSGAE